MKNRKLFIVIVMIAVAFVLTFVIAYCVKSQNNSMGPGNIPMILAKIEHINESSSIDVTVTEGNSDFNIGDKIFIENVESCYERKNNELIEIDDLSEGDTIMVMYFKHTGNTITSVRTVERMS